MKHNLGKSKRKFRVGFKRNIIISDLGKIELLENEQISFTDESERSFDVTRKSFGYYLTSSIEPRLADNNYKVSIVQSRVTSRYFVLLVMEEKLLDFENYCDEEKLNVIAWITNATCDNLKNIIRKGP